MAPFFFESSTFASTFFFPPLLNERVGSIKEKEEEEAKAKRLINYDPGERILKTCFPREKRIIRGIVGRLQMRRHRPQRVMHREQDSRTRIQGALTSSMSRGASN